VDSEVASREGEQRVLVGEGAETHVSSKAENSPKGPLSLVSGPYGTSPSPSRTFSKWSISESLRFKLGVADVNQREPKALISSNGHSQKAICRRWNVVVLTGPASASPLPVSHGSHCSRVEYPSQTRPFRVH